MPSLRQIRLTPCIVAMVCALGGGVGGCEESGRNSTGGKHEGDSGNDAGKWVLGALIVNEVMTDNHDTLAGANGASPDWVEVFNAGTESVATDGWFLTDDTTQPERWALPSGNLLPGDFLVVTTDGLDNDGERVTLLAPGGEVADILDVPALGRDESWGPQQVGTAETVVGEGDVARFSTIPEEGWRDSAFDDSRWATVQLGIGFDGTADGGESENAALDKPTTQSSNGYGFTGAQAVDGEATTISHTGDADLNPWWRVDLGGTWLIDSITLINRGDCCAERLYNVTVTILDAAGEMVWASDMANPTAEGTAPVSPGPRVDVTPPAGTFGSAARIDKVAVNGAISSEWLSLAEVVVTARVASPYAPLITTDVATAMAGTAAAFVRVPLAAGEAPTRAELRVSADDGFRAWVNGAEVAALNAPSGEASATDVATDERGADVGTYVIDPGAVGGVLAVEGLNVSAGDDDFLLLPELTLSWFDQGDPALFIVATPGAQNGIGVSGRVETPTAVPPRGFYDVAQSVVLTSPTPGATLVYTVDGTPPSETNGTIVAPSDPSSIATGTVTMATTGFLRAAAFRTGWATSPVATHTYLFLADVIRQPTLPAGMPDTWDGISESPVSGDYEMDPEVVDVPAYSQDLLDGLREIPTMSIVVDPDDLWSDDGIYINSAERGDAYERPASVELILPDGSTGFAETCGIRIHGYGWRYHSSTKKHSFRLEFSRTYGASKLEYPLFADAPVEKFDSIVLRAGGSKTWLDFRDPANAQYLHDSFARDTARDMGKVDGHATYVHLYLNGLYWGLYNPVERPEAGFGEEYFGGTDDEYDAINRRTVTNEAVDGNLDAYNAMLALADADLSVDANAAAVEATLDFDDLIDYMLIHQYTVNRDGPCCAASNNMRGLRRRQAGQPFRFFVWDMEYSLWDASESTNVDIDVAGSISHVYTRLRANAGFRQRFSDRALTHLTGDGALTPAACAERYAARADEIRNALVAESARWGDTYRATPYTRDVEWQAEYDRLVTEYFPRRTDQLLVQLREAGLVAPE